MMKKSRSLELSRILANGLISRSGRYDLQLVYKYNEETTLLYIRVHIIYPFRCDTFSSSFTAKLRIGSITDSILPVYFGTRLHVY